MSSPQKIAKILVQKVNSAGELEEVRLDINNPFLFNNHSIRIIFKAKSSS